MPKETFWDARSVEGDGSMPVLTVAWGQGPVLLNGIPFDDSGLTRAIAVLRKARKKTYRLPGMGHVKPVKQAIVGELDTNNLQVLR